MPLEQQVIGAGQQAVAVDVSDDHDDVAVGQYAVDVGVDRATGCDVAAREGVALAVQHYEVAVGEIGQIRAQRHLFADYDVVFLRRVKQVFAARLQLDHAVLRYALNRNRHRAAV